MIMGDFRCAHTENPPPSRAAKLLSLRRYRPRWWLWSLCRLRWCHRKLCRPTRYFHPTSSRTRCRPTWCRPTTCCPRTCPHRKCRHPSRCCPRMCLRTKCRPLRFRPSTCRRSTCRRSTYRSRCHRRKCRPRRRCPWRRCPWRWSRSTCWPANRGRHRTTCQARTRSYRSPHYLPMCCRWPTPMMSRWSASRRSCWPRTGRRRWAPAEVPSPCRPGHSTGRPGWPGQPEPGSADCHRPERFGERRPSWALRPDRVAPWRPGQPGQLGRAGRCRRAWAAARPGRAVACRRGWAGPKGRPGSRRPG